MGAKKRLGFVLAILVLTSLRSIAQDYVTPLPSPKSADENQDRLYTFSPCITLNAGTSFSLLNIYRISASFGQKAISLPPINLIVGYRKSKRFSLDAGVNYESFNLIKPNFLGGFDSSIATRLNLGIRSTGYIEIEKGNYISTAFRVGWLFTTGDLDLLGIFPGEENSIFLRTRGLTLQVAIGHQYRFAKNSSLHYELGIGNPYYFSLGYVHHFEIKNQQ